MMNNKGFTLIELVVVIVILGILAVTAVPKYINLKADAQTATLEGVKADMEGASALVHSKSLVKGNQNEPSDTINIGDGGGTSSNGELFITYGYPVANKLEWQRLIDVDTEHFNYRGLGGTGGTVIAIYRNDVTAPTSISDPCITYYEKPSGPGSSPSFILNECI
jgi:MSHA pilin protein MshA